MQHRSPSAAGPSPSLQECARRRHVDPPIRRIATPSTAALGLAVCSVMSACASTPGHESPALLTNASAATHAELVEHVRTALRNDTVTIAGDALSRDSTLVIERRPARDAAGRRLTGRDVEPPEQFQLVTDGRTCMLVHVRTGARYTLTQARCRRTP